MKSGLGGIVCTCDYRLIDPYRQFERDKGVVCDLMKNLSTISLLSEYVIISKVSYGVCKIVPSLPKPPRVYNTNCT